MKCIIRSWTLLLLVYHRVGSDGFWWDFLRLDDVTLLNGLLLSRLFHCEPYSDRRPVEPVRTVVPVGVHPSRVGTWRRRCAV